MAGRLLKVTGMALVIGIALITPLFATVTATPASADMVIDDCTIVSNPTPTHFTNCPGTNFAGANLSGDNLSYANLANANFSGDAFVECSSGTPLTCVSTDFGDANLTDANLTGIVMSATTGCSNSPPGCPVNAAVSFNGANLSGANMSNTSDGAADFSDANLTGANLAGANFASVPVGSLFGTVGAILTGANFTGTIVVPPNQSATATSQAGAAVTWSTPAGIPGATPGSCTPASGSTFPLFSSTVTCRVIDARTDAAVATGTFQVSVAPTTQYFTRVLVPSDGAVLASAPYLDAAAGDAPGVTSVVFELSGNGLSDQVIATATPTIIGWVAKWNTTSVPNGTYTLQSVATDTAKNTDTSNAITITVNNQPPTTAVLIPSDGATVSGTKTLLDASASSAEGIASVTYEVSGNGLSDQVVATGTPTLYGYLAQWNTTSVPNGTYTLQSVATDTVAKTTTSAGVSVTVDNSTTVIIPTNGATLDNAQGYVLDAVASPGATAVTFLGDGAAMFTATPTIYGWIYVMPATPPCSLCVPVSFPGSTIQAVATYPGGVTVTSPIVTVTLIFYRPNVP